MEKLNEDSHPERGNLFPSRMGITLVGLCIDDYLDNWLWCRSMG